MRRLVICNFSSYLSKIIHYFKLWIMPQLNFLIFEYAESKVEIQDGELSRTLWI